MVRTRVMVRKAKGQKWVPKSKLSSAKRTLRTAVELPAMKTRSAGAKRAKPAKKAKKAPLARKAIKKVMAKVVKKEVKKVVKAAKAVKATKASKTIPDEPPKMRFEKEAVYGIQEATESYIVELFKHANLCAIHAKRTKIFPSDFHIARILRGEIPVEIPLHYIDLSIGDKTDE